MTIYAGQPPPGTGDCCAVPPVPGCAVACRQATPGRPAGKPGVLPSIRRGGEPSRPVTRRRSPCHRGGTPVSSGPPLTVRDPGATTVRGDDAGRLMAGVSGRGCAGGRCNLGGGCHRVTASGRQRFPGRAHMLARPSAKARPGAASPHHRGAVCADAALPQEAPVATAPPATCTHSCDLCGAGCARADLRRPGGTPIGRSAAAGNRPGACPACRRTSSAS